VYGGASRYWIHQALASLDRALQQRHTMRMLYYDARGSSSLEVDRASPALRPPPPPLPLPLPRLRSYVARLSASSRHLTMRGSSPIPGGCPPALAPSPTLDHRRCPPPLARAQVLQQVVAATGARTVLWNRLYEPWCIERDMQVEAGLTGAPAGGCGRLSSGAGGGGPDGRTRGAAAPTGGGGGGGSGAAVRAPAPLALSAGRAPRLLCACKSSWGATLRLMTSPVCRSSQLFLGAGGGAGRHGR
jgi:hypothetical protein